MFDELCFDPPPDVAAMLMEGTYVRADPDHDTTLADTEGELEDRFAELAHATAGAVMVCGSAQNLDRLVTVFLGEEFDWPEPDTLFLALPRVQGAGPCPAPA